MLNLGSLAIGQPQGNAGCAVEFLLVSGSGAPDYVYSHSTCTMITTTGTSPYLYPSGTLFAKVVGATNSTA